MIWVAPAMGAVFLVELTKALIPWPIGRSTKLFLVLVIVSVLSRLMLPWGVSLKQSATVDAFSVGVALGVHEAIALLSNLRDLLKLRVLVGSRQAGVRR